jgi:DNA-binding transcriptional MerR regulator
MKTGEIIKKIGIPAHKLYYLEQKGYIHPGHIRMGDLESRDYTEKDALKIRLIWKYLKIGYKHKTAYQKAMEEMNQAGDLFCE